MKTTILLASTAFLSVAPSFAFVGAAASSVPRRSNDVVPTRPSSLAKMKQQQQNVLLNIRGGTSPSPDFLKASGSDYSEAARLLFGNIIGPASMLTGGLVPLGFLAEPLPVDKDGTNKWKKKARCLYQVLAVVSLLNELVAIMYATVATNKLTEVATAPAVSVFALIKRDYELQWIATNVHFLLGLLGFCSMIMLRALCIYPNFINTSSAGLALSALVGMVSILNVGIAEGDGQGHRLGGNAFWLVARYSTLLVKSFVEKRTVMGMMSFAMFLFFGAKTVRQLLNPESQEK